MDDILGLFANPTAQAATSPPNAAMSPLFNTSPVAPAAPAPTPAAPASTSYTAYQKNNLQITLTPQTNPAQPGVVVILAKFQTAGGSPASNVNFQAAVPKVRFLGSAGTRCAYLKRFSHFKQTQQLQMLPMSNSTVSPGTVETQRLKVTAPPGVGALILETLMAID